MSELMTVQEVAGHLRVEEKTIYQLLSRGQLPAIKIGRLWRFERAAIDNWVRQNTVREKADILVVDDEEMIRSLLKEILRDLGHRVIVAENGFDAVQN